jgi:hypothetical protein
LALGWNQSLHSFAYSGAVCDNDLFLDNSDRATPSIRDQMEYYYQQQDLAPDAETVFAFSVGVSDIHQAFMEQPGKSQQSQEPSHHSTHSSLPLF